MTDSETIDPSRSKKFHEGWVYHQGVGSKSWNKFWMVLRGNMVFIFENEHTSKCEMLGTLTVGPSTQIINLPSESKRKGFKFELVTPSRQGDKKANKLKFNTEAERDLWKSFIMGVAVGIVPTDVHLLPGPLIDVHEAIGVMHNTPPPPPNSRPTSQPSSTTIPRPKLSSSGQNGGFFFGEENGNSSVRSDGSGGSGDSGIFQMHLTMQGGGVRSQSVSSDDGGSINTLRDQLRKRQSDVAFRDLETFAAPSRQISYENTKKPSFENTAPLPRTPSYENKPFPHTGNHNETNRMSGRRTSFDNHQTDQFESPSYPSARRTSVGSPRDFSSQKPTSPPTTPVHKYTPNSNLFTPDQNPNSHPFFISSERNKETPSWFFEDCAREDAEGILTVGRRFGNVLMRPSSSNSATGKYVISMRREVSGGTQLNHYVIIPAHDGFKIDVDNDHMPMKCLSDVMDYFVSVAGPGTSPFRTNDLTKIYGSGFDKPMGGGTTSNMGTLSSVPPEAPPPPPVNQNWSSTPASDWTKTAPPNTRPLSSHAPVSNGSATTRPKSQSELFTQGQVSSAIRQAVKELNDTHTSYKGRWASDQQGGEPASPAPPPPPPAPPTSWGATPEYGNINQEEDPQSPVRTALYQPMSPKSPDTDVEEDEELKTLGRAPPVPPTPPPTPPEKNNIKDALPVRNTPTETMLRNGGHPNNLPDAMNRLQLGNNQDLDQGYSFSQVTTHIPQPPPPPPLSSMDLPSPSQAPPPLFNSAPVPPPPPPTSAMPSQPIYKASTPSSVPPQGGRGQGRNSRFGSGGGALSFEDELNQKLKPQREQIYASAQILRSNYK